MSGVWVSWSASRAAWAAWAVRIMRATLRTARRVTAEVVDNLAIFLTAGRALPAAPEQSDTPDEATVPAELDDLFAPGRSPARGRPQAQVQEGKEGHGGGGGGGAVGGHSQI